MVDAVSNVIKATLLFLLESKLSISSIESLFTLSSLSPDIEPEISNTIMISVSLSSVINEVSTSKVTLAFPCDTHLPLFSTCQDPGSLSSKLVFLDVIITLLVGVKAAKAFPTKKIDNATTKILKTTTSFVCSCINIFILFMLSILLLFIHGLTLYFLFY